MGKRWDIEADCAFDDVSEKLLAVGALTDFEPLPEPHERHRWHFPRLTPEQLDTLAADARGADVTECLLQLCCNTHTQQSRFRPARADLHNACRR